jgi:glycosyltransferase involved in cell wall biosynthesis
MRRLIETLFAFRPVRFIAGVGFLCRGTVRLRGGRLYRGLEDICWVERVSGIGRLKRIARRTIDRAVETMRRSTPNPLLESYRADPASEKCAALYSIAGPGSHDLFRDLIVLKRATPAEKGVILLKYGRTFDAVVALLDMARLMDRYTFVLEPCWAGYCDTSILQLITPGHPVVVQCFTDEDYEFIRLIGAPFVPVRLGPADWVDADLFKPNAIPAKPYDLVMVANWAPHKRHALLFRALAGIRDRRLRVRLVGFPWAGRTAADIRREASGLDPERVELDIVEGVPAKDVAAYVAECKAFVFLSQKEGDNKALVEAMFADVPAIVYENSIGGARSRINRATGILSSDSELAGKIVHMLDHYAEFTPRAWALEHTGSLIATRVLDETLRTVVTAAGARYVEPIVQKTNSPNLAYKEQGIRARFHADYEFVLSCRRRPVPPREAVA